MNTEIHRYVDEIIQWDLYPSDVLPSWLHRPLPLDRTSSSQEILIPQLIKTIGDDCNLLTPYLTRTESQVNSTIYCASASSGVGKTHLAYAAGLTGKCVSIIIRIAEQREEHGSAAFSAPWSYLFTLLERFEKYRLSVSQYDQKMVAHHAYRYIKLLILCYVHVTQIAIGRDLSLDQRKKCELALRFHRNCRGEELIVKTYQTLVAEMEIVDTETGLNVLCGYQMDQFYAKVKSSSIGIPLLLCFDEIQSLFDKFSEVFLSQQHYYSHQNNVVKSVCDDDLPTIVQESDWAFVPPPLYQDNECHQSSRGVFCALCCCMCDLAKECGWLMYMTGTSFSMTKFRKTASNFSPIRGNVRVVSPRARFSLHDMVSTLTHYWKFADEVFDTTEVQKALTYCKGRPLLFVNAVFIPLYQESYSSNFSGSVSASCLIRVIQRGINGLRGDFQRRMGDALVGGRSFPSSDTSKKSRYFLPHLVKALLFDSGKMTLSEKFGIGEAIATSLVCACAYHDDISDDNKHEIDISAEPLVAEVLKLVILRELQTNFNDVLRLLIETKLWVGKGDVAEIAFAYNIALLCYQHQTLHKGNGIPFADLVLPMFAAERQFLPDEVDRYVSFACQVVDCSDVKGECAFRRFIRDDGSVDDTLILTNLPKRMGADVAFIVSTFCDRMNMRVVVVQHKSDKVITLSEVMVTLSPGTQYLTKCQRQALLSNKRITNKIRADFEESKLGAGYVEWVDYVRFARTYPWMMQRWIRLPVIARKIAPEVFTFEKTGIYIYLKSEFTLQRLFRIRAAYESVVNGYKDSPIVFLYMDSEKWLTEDIRRLFVTEEGTGSMRLTTGVATWVPCSLDDSIRYCTRAGVKNPN